MKEIYSYPVVDDMPQHGACLDVWWFGIHRKFPLLRKYIVCPALTIFHNPRVESTFSLMKNVLDPKSSRMKTSTLKALQTIKYSLLSEEKSTLQVYQCPSQPSESKKELVANLRLASQRRVREQKEERLKERQERTADEEDGDEEED
jgi:hypothetical protein